MKKSPYPLRNASASELKQIRGVCLDIDETLSTKGKLTAEAYSALWKLKKAGFAVVPVTGRPAGWCDHIARFWPVDAVIGENGAFAFFMRKGVRHRLETPAGAPAATRKRELALLAKKIRKKFSEARWASDQAYREFDLAIDIREDVRAWPASRVNALLSFCHDQGAHAKLSSIHVNTWYGDYDKHGGLKHWLSKTPKMPAWNQWLFIGDSPNDEPLFAAFKYSVGVANLGKYLDRIKHPPRWITSRESGAGFTELVNRLYRS